MNKAILLSKAQDITINVKGKDQVIITKSEIIDFVNRLYDAKYINRAQAKKLTGISYLGAINVSAKIAKGKKLDYNTYIMYLAPYKSIFGNVCAQGQHCFKPCLNESGRVKMDVKEFNILRARQFRTMLYYVNREYFNSWLFAEISAHMNKPNFMVRLNGTSDISPVQFNVHGTNVLEAFPNVQFYDYTKIINRLDLSDQYDNYHITFSYNGYNQVQCDQALQRGYNVSVVMDTDVMPDTWRGKKVFNMDVTDLRPLDQETGSYGYLKLKETLNKAYDTAFIVNECDIALDSSNNLINA